MPGIDRVALTLFGFPIYWYGALIALAVVLGVGIAALREKQKGFRKDTTLDFVLLALPLALIGARIYYVIFSWSSYASNPLSIFNLREGGLAIFGGVIGGFAAALLFSRWRRISLWKLADLCAPSLILGQAIGRWGNFFNQEAYGRVIENTHFQFFPAAVLIESDGLWHAATFFYESVWCLGVFITLMLSEKHEKRSGMLFLLYLFLYSAERAVIEGLRTDSLMSGSLRISQWMSMALILCALIVFFKQADRHRFRVIVSFALAIMALLTLGIGIRTDRLPMQIISVIVIVTAGMVLYPASRPLNYTTEKKDV